MESIFKSSVLKSAFHGLGRLIWSFTKELVSRCFNFTMVMTKPFLYYSDLAYDVLLVAELTENCHWRYLSLSIFILVQSYIVTFSFLKYRLGLSWKKSLFYPYFHGKNLSIHIWQALSGAEQTKDSPEELLISDNIKFLEAMTEGLPQFALNCMIYREYGVIKNIAWLQVPKLFIPFLNILLCFGRREAFLKDKEEPGLGKLAGKCAYWLVSVSCFFGAMYYWSFSKYFSRMKVYLPMIAIHPLFAIFNGWIFSMIQYLADELFEKCCCKCPNILR